MKMMPCDTEKKDFIDGRRTSKEMKKSVPATPYLRVPKGLDAERMAVLTIEVINLKVSYCRSRKSKSILRKACQILLSEDDVRWGARTYRNAATQTVFFLGTYQDFVAQACSRPTEKASRSVQTVERSSHTPVAASEKAVQTLRMTTWTSKYAQTEERKTANAAVQVSSRLHRRDGTRVKKRKLQDLKYPSTDMSEVEPVQDVVVDEMDAEVATASKPCSPDLVVEVAEMPYVARLRTMDVPLNFVQRDYSRLPLRNETPVPSETPRDPRQRMSVGPEEGAPTILKVSLVLDPKKLQQLSSSRKVRKRADEDMDASRRQFDVANENERNPIGEFGKQSDMTFEFENLKKTEPNAVTNSEEEEDFNGVRRNDVLTGHVVTDSEVTFVDGEECHRSCQEKNNDIGGGGHVLSPELILEKPDEVPDEVILKTPNIIQNHDTISNREAEVVFPEILARAETARRGDASQQMSEPSLNSEVSRTVLDVSEPDIRSDSPGSSPLQTDDQVPAKKRSEAKEPIVIPLDGASCGLHLDPRVLKFLRNKEESLRRRLLGEMLSGDNGEEYPVSQ